MPKTTEPSYTDLVYEVLSTTERPLTFAEIFDDVSRRRPITTRDPKATIRNALTQGRQLVSLGDGRYGYLPHLLAGSLLRLPLSEAELSENALVYPEELRYALWPSFLESQKRRDTRPVHARLADGEEAVLPLQFLGPGAWGSPMPETLRRYLGGSRARAGDSLLIRVIDGEARRCELWFESRRKRDERAVAARNKELVDAAWQILRKSPSHEMPTWDLVIALLARGLYRSDVAPDVVQTALHADPRFVDAGMYSWILTEAVTPEFESLIRRRKLIEGELRQPAEDISADPALSPLGLRSAGERTMADVSTILSQREFGSIEEANAFLQEALVGGVPHRAAATPLERAQDLMYDAWDAPTRRERERLARKALDLSPDCADAYVLLAEETARGPKEAADLYAKGVAAGERALGGRSFKEDVGYFWGIIETRPYMRARLGLAQALWAMGKQQDALKHAWELLRLNPGDNQGVRYLLLNWLLNTGDGAQLKKLLDLYPDDAAAVWMYGRALHAFRTEGDTKSARERRAEAKKWNAYVPAYLLGQKRLPASLPQLIGFGDEAEAIVCAAEQLAAWRNTPGALVWLDARAGHPPTRRR